MVFQQTTHKQALKKYVGVMTGTSLDAVDLALIGIDEQENIYPLGHAVYDWPDDGLAQAIETLVVRQAGQLAEIADLEVRLTEHLAYCVNRFLLEHQGEKIEVAAIGCHGQTIFHAPPPWGWHSSGTSWQMMDGGRLAELTGIDVVCDFRRGNMARGGQGAPLVPPFHAACLADRANAVINIGGIANISYWCDDGAVVGYDLGPGNTLLDLWYRCHHPHDQFGYDVDGAWARQGVVISELLTAFLDDPYLRKEPPKSTGRERYHQDWLASYQPQNYKAVDVQRTLIDFLVQLILKACHQANLPAQARVVLSGGGARNHFLKSLLCQANAPYQWLIADDLGFNADAIEAQAFAWFAHCRLQRKSINWCTVTGGANGVTFLGAHYTPGEI